MTTELPTNTTQHMLLACIASLMGRDGQDPAASSVHRGGEAGPVIAACVDLCDFEARNLGLIEGPDRIADDEAREGMLEPPRDQRQVDLDVICWPHAATPTGNQARASRVALWDGGEIGYRATAPVGGFVDDRLVAAPLRDLAGLPW